MNFTVHWVAFAQSHLAAIWLAAPDRQAVTAAAHRIDLALARDAQLKGESREGGTRVLFQPPLGVYFDVNESAQEAWVRMVWHYLPRQP